MPGTLALETILKGAANEKTLSRCRNCRSIARVARTSRISAAKDISTAARRRFKREALHGLEWHGRWLRRRDGNFRQGFDQRPDICRQRRYNLSSSQLDQN